MTQLIQQYAGGDAPSELRQRVIDILHGLVSGHDHFLAVLRRQLQSLRVSAIEVSPRGILAKLEVAADAPRSILPNMTSAEAAVILPDQIYARCYLTVREGVLAVLEAYIH